MKISRTFASTASVLAMASVVSGAAFVVPSSCSSSSSSITSSSRISSPHVVLFSKEDPKNEKEEEPEFDLNLEEMFDIFDAADKEEKFDDAIKKVKGGEKSK